MTQQIRRTSLAGPAHPMSDLPVISCRHVTRRFGERIVLEDVSFEVYSGQTVAILGRSGCGKSTLLRLLVGVLAPDEGEVRIFGRNLASLTEDELNQVRKQVGIVFQSGALFNSMTLRDNVALPLMEHTTLAPEVVDIQVTIKLEMVGLREHGDKYPAQISGGMKKRAGLARALALDPRVLLYDEPTAGLDPVTSAEMERLIADLARQLGVTSVVVTHDMNLALSVADRVAMLDAGRIVRFDDVSVFRRLRDLAPAAAATLSETDRLVWQFLRGDPDGPLTARRSPAEYARDLLGPDPLDAPIPSIQPTR